MIFDKRNWLIKFKILHVLVWMTVSLFLMVLYYDQSHPLLPQWLGTMVLTGLAVPACYFSAYRLTPRFLYQKRIGAFVGYVLLLVIVNTVLTYIAGLFVYHLLTGLPMFPSVFYVIGIGTIILWDNIFLIVISCSVKIIFDRFSMERQLVVMENEKIATELNFLRSQVNPHFLFNVMNTIYFQIDKTNTQARNSIEKLSEMLRYQLYDCTSDKIDIIKEIEYIKNYVVIQSLRMEKGTDIALCIDENISGFFIAPLLILPVIENAFKHVSNYKDPTENKIHISLNKKTNDEFIVAVSNTYNALANTKHLLNSSGLGMQNLKRRLELLYPGKHELTINNDGRIFQIKLKIAYRD